MMYYLTASSVQSQNIRMESVKYLNAFVHHSKPGKPQSLHKDFRVQYLVITGQKNEHRAGNIMSTWGPTIGTANNDSVTFITDSQATFKDQDSSRISSSTLSPPSASTPSAMSTLSVLEIAASWSISQIYRQSQLKWLRALLLWDTFPPFDWLVFLDDDTFLIHNSMREMLQLHDSSTPLLLAKKNGVLSVCGGAGMVMSKRMVQKLMLPSNRLKLMHAFESAVNNLDNNRAFYSDVILSKFIIDHKIGKIINIRELKNEGSDVIMGWYKKHPDVNKSAVISYHHVTDRSEYFALYEHYYLHKHTKVLT